MPKIKIKDIQQDTFSRCCLRELKSEQVNEGDIIEIDFINPEHDGVDFISPKTGVPCMAYKGITCEVLEG